jgi:hypothetical protein
MPPRLSANEVRQISENAQKAIAEEKLKEKELQKIAAKTKSHIKSGYKKQKNSIIAAAIDGDKEIQLDTVFLFKDLIQVGLVVRETGSISSRVKLAESRTDQIKIVEAKDSVMDAFSDFIDESKRDLKDYYFSFKELHENNLEVLLDEMKSNSTHREFGGDEIYADEVSSSLKKKYQPYIDSVNQKLLIYKKLYFKDKLDQYLDDEPYEDIDPSEGEYTFTIDDDTAELLKPASEGNFFTIKWDSEVAHKFMNNPIFSKEGLSWLSDFRGNILIESIFEYIVAAAEEGLNYQTLTFSLTNDGWYFNKESREIYCCNPNDLIEIIKNEKYTVLETKSSEKSFTIKVAW